MQNTLNLEPPKIGGITRFLVWCAGVDRTEVPTRAEAMRYSGLGALVIVVALVGTATFTGFVCVVMGRFAWPVLLIGLFWGLVILSVDRMILLEPVYRERQVKGVLTEFRQDAPGGGGEEEDDREGGDEWRLSVETLGVPEEKGRFKPGRWLAYLVRLAIAFVLAFLVAETAILLLFQQEIKATLPTLHREAFDKEVAVYVQQQKDNGRKTLEDRITTLTEDRRQLKEDAEETQDLMAKEKNGEGGDRTTGLGGYGGQWRALKEKHDGLLEDIDEKNKAIDTERKNLKKFDERIDLIAAYDDKEIGKTPALVEAKNEIYGNQGFSEQQRAFHRYLDAHPDDVIAAAGPWAIRILLIAIDLLPLSQKLRNKDTGYTRRISTQALLLRAREAHTAQRELREEDRRAWLRDLRRRHDNEVERRRAAWRERWRMNHMREE
ncbi:DUF4407 domain-containing protein [Actinocorallia sp. B10E7]|uniref:DUF4407 domain-containing protein n=1 Tax=Actinocorallia sp. B10E7 TaxID=3153558 RepID=UPI00325E6EBE